VQKVKLYFLFLVSLTHLILFLLLFSSCIYYLFYTIPTKTMGWVFTVISGTLQKVKDGWKVDVTNDQVCT